MLSLIRRGVRLTPAPKHIYAKAKVIACARSHESGRTGALLLGRRQDQWRIVPGIGPILGTTILLESGAIERFASVGDYASHCRMVESVRLSNGKRKCHGNRKCADRYLCWAFMEAANYAVRYDPVILRWYERKRVRKHRVAAIKAVAHKLARACYHMLHEGTTFDLMRAFG